MPTTMPLLQLITLMALVCVVSFGIGRFAAWWMDK